MKKTAYLKITENMTPRDASDKLLLAKRKGYSTLFVFHGENADITNAKYKDRLLSVLRAAYRHGVSLYIADDSFPCSGTAFTQLCSVKNLQLKTMRVKSREALCENDEVIFEKDGRCVTASFCPASAFPYGAMPDLTNKSCASLIIDSVYKPLLNEYKKFVGYEFKGFLCDSPRVDFSEFFPVFSASAIEKYGKSALFDLCDGKNEAAYLKALEKAVDENFISPLKNYCAENNMQFAVGTPDGFVTFENSKAVKITRPCDALTVYKAGFSPIVKIGPHMEKIQNIGKIFEEYPNCEIVEYDSLSNFDNDCFVITNTTKASVSFSFLIQGDWCVYDWEKDELYNMEKHNAYTLFRYGFLCIVKKESNMYAEKLPFFVCGALTDTFTESNDLFLSRQNNNCTFSLPDENLTDSALKIVGDAQEIKLKIGSMEYEFSSDTPIVPLFDFQREANCVTESEKGSTEKVVILTKAPLS